MATVYSLSGKPSGNIELPAVFKTEYRPDLIQRAVVSQQASRRQKYGTDPYAGLRTSADYFGNRKHSFRQTINKGMSRLPREKTGGGGLGKVRRVPQSVKGMSSHPPVNKDHSKKINKKEYEKAFKSAIAATADKAVVERRGHKLGSITELPMVVEDAFESLGKTRDVLEALKNLGLDGEIERGRVKKTNAGKGKSRGRPYDQRKSVLIVVNEDKGVVKSAGNIPGVDATTVGGLDVEILAPGTHAGRMTLWTRSAIESVK